MKRGLSALLSATALSLLSTWAGAAPQGEVRYVGVKSLPVKKAPFGLSMTIAPLRYGAQVTLVPDNLPNANGATQKKNAQSRNAASPATPNHPWVKVLTGNIEGYVPVASLMTPDLFERQKVRQDVEEVDLKAGKGFSDSEDPDVIAAKGALGKVSSGQADTAALDKLLQQQKEGDVTEDTREFRHTGKVGEFKSAEVKP